MSAKVTVAVIAQADKDIELLQKPLGEIMLKEPHSYADMASQITAAYQRLARLVKELMGAEITVRGT